MDKDLRCYVAELCGSFAVVFLGAAIVCASKLGESQVGLLAIAATQGFALAAALAATAHLSGGYLNPAVTLTLYVYKRLELGKAVLLIGVQILGAMLAGGLLRLVLSLPETALAAARLGTPHLNSQWVTASTSRTAMLYGIGIELALTIVLTFIIFATMIDPRAPRALGRTGRWLAPLWVGLGMVAITLAGYSWTGAAVNPARYLGTMVWELTLAQRPAGQPQADHLVYWVGPMAGALLAGAAYTYLILPAEEEQAPSASPGTGGRISAGAVAVPSRSKK